MKDNMADLLNIRFDGDKAFIEGRIENLFDMLKAKHLLRKAVDDIADKIEHEARANAPGSLSEDGVGRDDTRITIRPEIFDVGFGTPTGIPLFGGGFAVRGPRGRFISPSSFRPAIFSPGELIARSELFIPKEPFYAKYVHGGTGIHGPRHKRIFPHAPHEFFQFGAHKWPQARFKKKTYRFKSTAGQEAQPYLENAYLLINGTYVPERIQLLRAQIAAET